MTPVNAQKVRKRGPSEMSERFHAEGTEALISLLETVIAELREIQTEESRLHERKINLVSKMNVLST